MLCPPESRLSLMNGAEHSGDGDGTGDGAAASQILSALMVDAKADETCEGKKAYETGNDNC